MDRLIDSLVVALPAALAFLLFRFWYKQGYYHAEISQVRNQQQVYPKLAAQQRQIKEIIPAEQNDAARKGNDFEKFVIDLFDSSFFTLLEWRSDKIHNGIYPLSSMNPDMEFQFTSRYDSLTFAVECKWRQDFTGEQVQWAKDYQLLNYRRFEHAKNMPVFVIIGVGGSPSTPEEMFVIPLDRIQSTNLSRSQLNAFKRFNPGKPFYLSMQNMRLQ